VLEAKHLHKVVAIHKGEVISIGTAYEEVMKKLHKLEIKKSFIHRLGLSENAIAILPVFGGVMTVNGVANAKTKQLNI
jgi:hypothetical protein